MLKNYLITSLTSCENLKLIKPGVLNPDLALLFIPLCNRIHIKWVHTTLKLNFILIKEWRCPPRNDSFHKTERLFHVADHMMPLIIFICRPRPTPPTHYSSRHSELGTLLSLDNRTSEQMFRVLREREVKAYGVTCVKASPSKAIIAQYF